MHYVYILKSTKDDKLYIGSTESLERRLKEHTAGKVRSTAYRRPLTLVYTEKFGTKKEALQREKYFKGGGKAHKLLEELINNKGAYFNGRILVSKTSDQGSSPCAPAEDLQPRSCGANPSAPAHNTFYNGLAVLGS